MMNDKFLQSQQTLNTDRASMNNSFDEFRKYSSEVFINPYPKPQTLKFPKNKSVRKQTQMNTLIQSVFNPERLCLKPFSKANKHTLDEIPEIKRIAKYGLCNPLSKSLDVKHQTSLVQQFVIASQRSFDDIGVSKNMKKTVYEQKYKPDPIIIGDQTKKVTKSNSSIWNQERKHRDNGKVAKQTLNWKVDSIKKKNFYSGKMPQKKVDLSKSGIFFSNQSHTDYSRVLNYQRKK